MIHPDDRNRVESVFADLVATPGKKVKITMRTVRKDGSVRWLEGHGHNLLHNPAVGAVVVNWHDVTERVAAEDKLRQTEARLRFLISSNPAIIYTCQASGNYAATYVSDTIKDVLGYTPEEFMRKPSFWADHIHPEDRHRVYEGLSKLFAHGRLAQEYRFQHHDGSWRWMHDQLLLIRDDAHEPVEIIGEWLDITEHRQIEDRLRLEEGRLHLALDAAHMLVWDWNIEANEIAFSEDYGKFFGLAPTGTTMKNDDSMLEPVFPDDRGPLVDAFQRSLDTGQDFQLQFRGKSRDGANAWYPARPHAESR